MGFLSTLGGVVGGFFGMPQLGVGIGSLLDGAQSRRDAQANSNAGKLDLSHLRSEALANGFNPLTVLRATGGAGSHYGPAIPSFFSSVGQHFDTALNRIFDREEQQASIRNLDALTGLYGAETAAALRPSAVVAASRPVFSSNSGPSQTAPTSGGAPTYGAPLAPSGGRVGGRPTGPAIGGVNPDGLENLVDNGRSSWSLFGFDITPYPGNSDAETLEARGAEVMSNAGGAANLISDPLYTIARATGFADDVGFTPVTGITDALGVVYASVIEPLGQPLTVNDGRQYNTYEFGVEP